MLGQYYKHKLLLLSCLINSSINLLVYSLCDGQYIIARVDITSFYL